MPNDKNNPGKRPWPRGVIIGVILVLGIGLLYGLMNRFPERMDDTDEILQLILALGWVVLIGSFVFHRNIPPGKTARDAGIWLAIGLVLFTGYSFHEDAAAIGKRLYANLVPGAPVESGDGAVRVARAADGHFHVEALVLSTPVRFLVDTGASVVVLTRADARRVGIDPRDLRFDRQVSTANGTTMAAAVRLPELRIGPIVVRDVRALVNGGAMPGSLLGMSLLSRLGEFSIENNLLVLRSR